MSTKRRDLDAHLVTFSLTGSGSDETVAHTLGRVPAEAFITLRSTSANIYRGSAAWTSTSISLRASAVAGGSLLLF